MVLKDFVRLHFTLSQVSPLSLDQIYKRVENAQDKERVTVRQYEDGRLAEFWPEDLGMIDCSSGPACRQLIHILRPAASGDARLLPAGPGNDRPGILGKG